MRTLFRWSHRETTHEEKEGKLRVSNQRGEMEERGAWRLSRGSEYKGRKTDRPGGGWSDGGYDGERQFCVMRLQTLVVGDGE